MYEWTSDGTWKNWAVEWTLRLADQQFRTTDHEAGFILPPSYGNGYRLTNDTTYRRALIQAARSLATRYNSVVGCVRSWQTLHFPVIIDGMVAIRLLWWASKETGDTTLYAKAMSHSLKTMENNVRPDGSCYQIVDYNPTTGQIYSRQNKQGYTSSTTWSRGQAWAIYGFTIAYRETGDGRFAQTAQRAADYFVDNLPLDNVPYWDFQAPKIPNEEKDVSAAAIAASGLLELSSLISSSGPREKYRNAAVSIIASLCSPAYLAAGTSSRAILLHGVGNRMNDDRDAGEVDVSLIYADYFFLEALTRYLKISPPVAVIDDRSGTVPTSIHLLQNYPNPFNSRTIISFELPRDSWVELSVMNLLGEKVGTLSSGFHLQGKHSVVWHGNDASGRSLSSGTYFYQLRADAGVLTKRMILIK